MSENLFYDPNATLDYTYDTEETAAEIKQLEEAEEIARTQEAMETEASELSAAQKSLKEKEPAKPEAEPETEDKGFLGGMMESIGGDTGIAEQAPEGQFNTDSMGGKQRVIAGGIDLAMDAVSALIPALKPADEWWEEKSGRNAGKDPFKKAERDIGGMMLGTIIGGGLIGKVAQSVPGVVNLGARTKFFGQAAADLGVDALLSGVSDTTREPGNMANIAENFLPNGVQIPWASRDNDSPDTTFAKNMIDNMLLGITGESVHALFALRGGNKIKPLNTIAEVQVKNKAIEETKALVEAKGDPVIAAVLRNRAKKKAAQLGIAKRVLKEDPEGVNGYNAFVNDPAEPIDRITLDETASPIDFMADQARIKNNVETFDGRARPLINNDDIELLSRADSATRNELLNRVAGDLGAKFDLTVGKQRLTKLEVEESINTLYDTALQSEEGFEEAVKGMRNTEVNLFSLVEKHSDAGQQELLRKTASRLLDAVSPYKQRGSAAIQTQAAGSVSDISRNIDLMSDVSDTSRLQELVMPRLRVLLKEAEGSKAAQRISNELRAKFQKKTKDIDGLLELEDNYLDNLLADYDSATFQAGKKIDEFVDTLEDISKQNPALLRPMYRMWAKSNGEIDSLYKMNQYTKSRLGFLTKAFIDGNPEVPSILLRELNGVRMANLLNGLAPAKTWVGNASALVIKPATIFAGAVPRAIKGDLKPIQRAWYMFSGGLETFNRARKLAQEELRFANANPDAAMARGRTDYNMSDQANPGGNDWRKALSDFEEFEELSETWSPGRQALWNLTKTTANWNRKSWNRWGTHQMYSSDGFVKSMMASANARGGAYDKLFQENGGSFSKADFQKIERQLYSQTFDENGLLKDGYAKFTSEEIALNADVPLVNAFQTTMDHLPIFKSIFMFPKTRLNQFSVVQTFDPTGILGAWKDRSSKVLRAQTPDEIADVLDAHGMKGATMEEFEMLRSEYIGRKMMTSGVVMTTAIMAANGRVTGAGPSDPTENKKWRDLGNQPYHIDIGIGAPDWRSYDALPAWAKSFIGLTADVTREFTDADSEVAQDWYRTIADAIQANVTNDLFAGEIENLNGLVNGNGVDFARYASNMIDSMIFGTSVRSTLSSILVPQLQDVENNFIHYLANRNRWIPAINDQLADRTDVFTGDPIGADASPVELLLSKLLPGFRTKSGREPWRQWLMTTGWDGLSKPMTNKMTLEELTPPQRKWINDWIGKHLNLDEKVEELMTWEDGKWDKELKEYTKKKGMRSQDEFPIKETFIHEYLDDMMIDAYDQAWAAYEAQNAQFAEIKPLKEARNRAIREGNFNEAGELADKIKVLTEQPVK